MAMELERYVREQLASGYSKEAVRTAAEQAGWTPAEIDQVFLTSSSISAGLPSTPPPSLGKEMNTHPLVSETASRTRISLYVGIVLSALALIGIVLFVYFSNMNGPLSNKELKDVKTIKETQGAVNVIETGKPLDKEQAKKRDNRRVNDLQTIRLSLELYFDAKKEYPLTLASLAPVFIPTIPTDPSTKQQYLYAAIQVEGQCSSYHLGANMENEDHLVLQRDADGIMRTICTGSRADFQGKAPECRVQTASSPDKCYDLVP